MNRIDAPAPSLWTPEGEKPLAPSRPQPTVSMDQKPVREDEPISAARVLAAIASQFGGEIEIAPRHLLFAASHNQIVLQRTKNGGLRVRAPKAPRDLEA